MFKPNKSQALVIVILVMIITLGLGASFLFYTRSVKDITRIQSDTDKAHSLAKTGLQMAIRCVKTEPLGCTIDPDQEVHIGDGTYQIYLVKTQVDLDGNYFITADITSTGKAGKSTSVLKESMEFLYESPATTSWAILYGTESSYLYSRWSSLQQTPDQGYIVSGSTGPEKGIAEYCLFKTGTSGDLDPILQKVYIRGRGDTQTCLEQTQDVMPSIAGYIIGGWGPSLSDSADFYVLRTDLQGTFPHPPHFPPAPWAMTYGGEREDVLLGLEETIDSNGIPTGYIMGGYTNSFGTQTYDFLVVRTNSDGAVEWANTYGGAGSDYLYAIQQTFSPLGIPNGYILAGSTNSFGTSTDCFLIKIRLDGSVEWARTYGNTSGTTIDEIRAVKQTRNRPDGPADGYILVGSTFSFGAAERDILLIRVDLLNGDLVWAQRYERPWDDFANAVQQTFQGNVPSGYIIGGYTQQALEVDDSDFFPIKVDTVGNIEWAKMYLGDRDDQLYSLEQASNGEYLLSGFTESFKVANPEVLFIKTDPLGDVGCPSAVENVSGACECGNKNCSFCYNVTSQVTVRTVTVTVVGLRLSTGLPTCNCVDPNCLCIRNIFSDVTAIDKVFNKTDVTCSPAKPK